MKLLITLILLILTLNCYYSLSINKNLAGAGKTQTFANFHGTFDTNDCTSGSVNGTGYSLSLDQCTAVTGILSYVINDGAQGTLWRLTMSGSNLVINQYNNQDTQCKQKPIHTITIPSSQECVETPAFLNNENQLYSLTNGTFSTLTFSTGKPIYAENSIVYALYNTEGTLCIFNNQQFAIQYPSGSTIFENAKNKITVLCNEVDQSMMYDCLPNGKNCHENFIDTYCQTSGDITISCNSNNNN